MSEIIGLTVAGLLIFIGIFILLYIHFKWTFCGNLLEEEQQPLLVNAAPVPVAPPSREVKDIRDFRLTFKTPYTADPMQEMQMYASEYSIVDLDADSRRPIRNLVLFEGPPRERAATATEQQSSSEPRRPRASSF